MQRITNSLILLSQESEYTYAYVGLSWAEYWAAENVQAAGDTSSSDAKGFKRRSLTRVHSIL